MNDLPTHPTLRQSLFITGTDTGVGKTMVSVAVLKALVRDGFRAAGMKPVAAGAAMTSHGLRNEDALDLTAAGNVRLPYHLTNPCCLADATAPHLAAEREGVGIDVETILEAFIKIGSQSDAIIVEGAGGWLVPIGSALAGRTGPTMENIALMLGLPVVLVVVCGWAASITRCCRPPPSHDRACRCGLDRQSHRSGFCGCRLLCRGIVRSTLRAATVACASRYTAGSVKDAISGRVPSAMGQALSKGHRCFANS